MTPHLNGLIETVQMSGHNICFSAELTKNFPKYTSSYLELSLDRLGLHWNEGWVLCYVIQILLFHLDTFVYLQKECQIVCVKSMCFSSEIKIPNLM